MHVFDKYRVIRDYIFRIADCIDYEDRGWWKEVSPFIFYRWLSMHDKDIASRVAGLQRMIERMERRDAIEFMRRVMPARSYFPFVPYLTKSKATPQKR